MRERSVVEEVREGVEEEEILRVQEWETQPWAERGTRPSDTGWRKPMACTKPSFSRMDWKMGRRQARISGAARHARWSGLAAGRCVGPVVVLDIMVKLNIEEIRPKIDTYNRYFPVL